MSDSPVRICGGSNKRLRPTVQARKALDGRTPHSPRFVIGDKA
jgi:hypothetical protein